MQQHTFGLTLGKENLLYPYKTSIVDGFQRFRILYSAFIFCRLFHNCIFNICGKSIMKVFQLLAQVEKNFCFCEFL